MKIKVVIADDDPAILEGMRLMLEDAGYDVETSYDGSVLYANVDKTPDLIMVDIMMGPINGQDLCRYIKRTDSLSSVPVLMFSAHRDGEKLAKEAGADGFIAKPFDPNDLLCKIEMMVYNKAR